VKKQQSRQERFSATLDTIIAVQPLWKKANATQRAVYETIVGAAIFYCPSDKSLQYSGLISQAALEVASNKRCQEHMFPRKVSAQRALDTDWSQFKDPVGAFIDRFHQEYGRYHLVTKEENSRLRPHQKTTVFTTWQAAYEKAEIVLVEAREVL
jgi:hypothetical protein